MKKKFVDINSENLVVVMSRADTHVNKIGFHGPKNTEFEESGWTAFNVIIFLPIIKVLNLGLSMKRMLFVEELTY